MKKSINFINGISLFIALFSVNVFAQDSNLSQEQILQIQDRVDSMTSIQLIERKAQLLIESEDLQNEQASSQSPARLKSISERLDEISAEMGMIETILLSLGGLAILESISDSDSRDITPPVITVLGANPVTVERGDTYVDAGATADGGESVSTNLGGLNTNVAGTYTITYSASDASQNTGYATRTVNVVDTTNPVVTVTGDNPATVELGDTYTDAGATTTEGTVSSSGTVDTSTVGSYTITYSATDASGNTGTATRTVNVVDTTAPVFTSSASFSADENQTAIGTVTATDLQSVTFSVSGTELAITSGGVLSFVTAPDYETKSSYTATVTASDLSSNSATQDITVTINDVGGIDDDPGTGTGTGTGRGTGT